MESLNSQSVLPPDPPLWVKLGSNLADFEFLPLSPLLLLL